MTFDVVAATDELRTRAVNYDEAHAPPHVTDGWHQDRWTATLGHEPPGEPLDDGLVSAATALVDAYEFTDPALLRATFRQGTDLVGRDMLLEGRFLRFRFPIGVRITSQLDELRDGRERVVGWAYQTLQGHLEQGRLTYEIAKDLPTGRVEFRIDAYSRRAPIRNPLFAAGFAAFGRRTQLRFYRRALARLSRLMEDRPAPAGPAPDGLIHAPSDAEPPGRFAAAVLRFPHPGR